MTVKQAIDRLKGLRAILRSDLFESYGLAEALTVVIDALSKEEPEELES